MLRATRITYDETPAGDPRRGAAAPDRPRRRGDPRRRGHGHARPQGRADLEREAPDRRPAAARGGRGAPQGRPVRDALPHGRELLHHLRRRPDADLGDPGVAGDPRRGRAPDLLRERAARAARDPGRLPAARQHPRAGGGARQRVSRAVVPAVEHLRLRLQAALLQGARTLGGRHDHAVSHLERRHARRRAVPPPVRRRRLRRRRRAGVQRRARQRQPAASRQHRGRRKLRARRGLHRLVRPGGGERQQLSRAVRLFRRRPADQHRRHPPHPRQRVCLARHHRVPEPQPGRGHRHHSVRVPGVHLPPADRHARDRRADRARRQRARHRSRPRREHAARRGGDRLAQPVDAVERDSRRRRRRARSPISTRSGTTTAFRTAPTRARCR